MAGGCRPGASVCGVGTSKASSRTKRRLRVREVRVIEEGLRALLECSNMGAHTYMQGRLPIPAFLRPTAGCPVAAGFLPQGGHRRLSQASPFCHVTSELGCFLAEREGLQWPRVSIVQLCILVSHRLLCNRSLLFTLVGRQGLAKRRCRRACLPQACAQTPTRWLAQSGSV